MIFNNPTMNPTMTTAVNTTANANVREITLTTKILNPKTKEDGTITGLLLFSKPHINTRNSQRLGQNRGCPREHLFRPCWPTLFLRIWTGILFLCTEIKSCPVWSAMPMIL